MPHRIEEPEPEPVPDKCRTCGGGLVQGHIGRRKIYCSKKCRDTRPGYGTCGVAGCDEPAGLRKGLCVAHYGRLVTRGDVMAHIPLGAMRRGQDTREAVKDGSCRVEDCSGSSRTGGYGYCAAHQRRVKTHGDPLAHIPVGGMRNGQAYLNLDATCRIEGCDRPARTRELCVGHYSRFLNGTLETDDAPIRLQDKGGLRTDGYRAIRVGNHPNSWGNGQILEHIFVMSEHLGRPIASSESVHHKNGVRDDNRIENLELRVRYHGKGQSVDDRIDDAVETLRRYAPHMLA